MKRSLITFLLLCAAYAEAFAQVPYFPQTLPAGTVVGRLRSSAGPTEAIPFSTFSSALGVPPAFSANLGRFEGNTVPTPLVSGSTGVEIGDTGAYGFIQTAVRPTFAYGSQDLHIISGGSLIFQTAGLNTHTTIGPNGQFAIATDPSGQYTGLNLTLPSPAGSTASANCVLNLVYCHNTISIGQTAADQTAFPSYTLVANAATLTSSNVLHFASVPSTIAVGQVVYDVTTNSALAQNTVVTAKSATTVTLNQNATGAGVANGDTISFSPAGAWANGLTLLHQYGGSAVNGGRQSFYVYSILNGATSFGNGNNQYVGIISNTQAQTSDGGTDLTTNAKGGIFSLNTIAALNAGATNFNEVGIEFDTVARAGSSVKYKNGISIVALGDDAVRGSSYDAALSISSQNSGSVGWLNGILFSDANNGHAIGADGCLICTQNSWTVTTGFDASSYTITGYFLKGPGAFSVSGAGVIAAPTATLNGNLNFLGSTSGSASFVRQAVQGSPSIVIPTGSGTIVTAASSPLSLNTTTGALSLGIGTGLTTSGGNIILTAPVTVALGGTNATSASGTALDNITGFSGTGFLTRTGSGTYAFQSATNGVTLSNLAQIATNTVLGNSTSGTADVSALAVGSCSTAASALKWTTNTGFGCNTSITAAAVPASGLTGATLASGVTASSLTSVGTLTSLTVSGMITGNANLAITANQNSQLNASVNNTNAGAGAYVSFDFVSSQGNLSFLNGSAALGLPPQMYSTVAGELKISAQGTGGFITLYTGTGGTERARLSAAGGLSINTTSDPGAGMIYTNAATFMNRTKTSWSTGAAAATGTLTNAPTAGNPTKWIPVDDNGTTRYVPAW